MALCRLLTEWEDENFIYNVHPNDMYDFFHNNSNAIVIDDKVIWTPHNFEFKFNGGGFEDFIHTLGCVDDIEFGWTEIEEVEELEEIDAL